MTISDANWNAASDPFVQSAPSFSGTPSPDMAGANLTGVEVTISNALSGICDDLDRQVVVLVHDTSGEVLHFEQFYLFDDRADAGAAEFHTYAERWNGSGGDQYQATFFAGIIVVGGSSTCRLHGLVGSFPNNEYRMRVTRYPSYRDRTLAQLLFAIGQHTVDELPIWDDQALGNFFEPREFMDKDSFQTNSDKANHQRFNFISRRGETVESLIMGLAGQTADFSTIRPSDTNDGVVSLHLYHHEDLPERRDVVLDSGSLSKDPHVLAWELRTGVVEPISGIDATYGHYHVRKYNDGATLERLLKNEFPLEYRTGEDRFIVGTSPDRVVEMEFPNMVVTGHGLDRGGILAQFPIYTRAKSQDELEIVFDWYGLNFMPGDKVNVFVSGLGWDSTNGETFIVNETAIEDAIHGTVKVTLRRAWGIGNPHPYDWRDASDLAGSEPSEDWPFLFSSENLRFVGMNENIFGSTDGDFAQNWLNTFGHVRETGDYSTDEDENMIEEGALGAIYKPGSDSQAPYGWPSVWFVTGGKVPAQPSPPANYGSGDALLWWVWRAIDLDSTNKYLLHHVLDGNNEIKVYTVGGGAGAFDIRVKVGGVVDVETVTVSEDYATYVIAQFGGTDRVNVSGTEDTGVGWSSFPGIGTGADVYFGTDGAGAGAMNANVAEIGLVLPQSPEDVDTMYAQLEAYIREKYGVQ